MTIFFFPVGLYGLWKNRSIAKGWKIGVSGFYGVYMLFIFIMLVSGDPSTSDSESPATTSRYDVMIPAAVRSLSDYNQMVFDGADIQFKSDIITYDANTGEEIEQNIDNTIAYEVLRRYTPLNISNSVGLDILINRHRVSEGNIMQLVKSLVPNSARVAVVTVYTSKNAWEEGQRGSDFSDEYDEHYIAYYVKNSMKKGPFQGANEIRWMQEIGPLSDKFGTATKL